MALKTSKVRTAFHWPKMLVDPIKKIRNQLEKYDGDYDEHWDYDQNYSHSRPGTPHSMRYNNNETTF